MIQATTRGGWLARQGVTGTARAVEISRGPEGWHIHSHVLLTFGNQLSPDDFQRFALTLHDRYMNEAERLGIRAEPEAQDIARARSATAWARYIAKGHMRVDGDDGPASLWAEVMAGDADALALIHELEAGSFRRRMFTTTGVCRPRLDLDQLLATGALDAA